MNCLSSKSGQSLISHAQAVVVTAVAMLFLLLSTVATAGDDPRWFSLSLPEFEKFTFDINKTAEIEAFESGNGNYDVTLVDEYGRMVRLDIATGQHWEILPMSYDDRKPSTNVAYFQLSNNEVPTNYLGRIYYPYNGDPVSTQIGRQRVAVDTSTPYPVKGGFRGIAANSEGRNVYVFTANRKFETGTVAPLSLGEFRYRASAPVSVTPSFGRITRSVAMSKSVWTTEQRARGGRIACIPLTGQMPFAFSGYSFYSLHTEWHREAVITAPVTKTLAMIYAEGVVQLGQGRRVVPFPEGYKLRTRDRFVKSSDGGETFTLLIEGPDSSRELWSFDTASLKIQSKLKLPGAKWDARFDESADTIAVQLSRDRSDIVIYERQSGSFSQVGRTTPLTDYVGRAKQWALSDDGKVLFFVTQSAPYKDELRLGCISVDSLRFRETQPAQNVNGGFGDFRQQDLSFEELPTDAPPCLVGVLPAGEYWWKISPNDRWAVGNGDRKIHEDDDLQLYDTASQTSHMIPSLGDNPGLAFSEDSSLLAVFEDGDVYVWNVAGNSPILVAASTHLPEKQRETFQRVLHRAEYGACHVSDESISTTNTEGSVRFLLEGNSLRLEHNSELKARHAKYSPDGNSLCIWKDDGAIWEYEWNGNDWRGKSKFKVSGYEKRIHDQPRLHAMDAAGEGLVIYTREGLSIWNEVSETDHRPLSTVGRASNALGFDTLMDWAAISHNHEWIVSVQEADNTCVLTLWDRNLKQLKTHQLPFRFRSYDRQSELHVTNDGKHAVVCDRENHAYVIRL